MDNAAIIGNGIVGNATGNVFGIEKRFDIDETKSNASLKDIARCRYTFLCLSTPFIDNVGYNTKPIIDLIKQIEEYGANCLYIIRSTVNPGFARHIMDTLGIDRIISNPEFLSQDTAEKDIKNPPFILLGGYIPRYLQEVKAVYEGRIKGAPVILTDNTTAELAKLVLNGFFSTKVIYANQVYDVARSLSANYETIRDVLERHPSGFRNHARIWYKGKRGVNGKCLPKDSKALAFYTGGQLFKKIVELNEEYIYLRDENV